MFLCSVLVCAVFAFSIVVSNVRSAASVTSSEILNPVGLLWIDILTGDATMYLVDADGMTEDENYTLPDVDQHDGDILLFKLTGGVSEYIFNILPASGDKIDDNTSINISSPSDFYMLLGDSDNATWWIIGRN